MQKLSLIGFMTICFIILYVYAYFIDRSIDREKHPLLGFLSSAIYFVLCLVTFPICALYYFSTLPVADRAVRQHQEENSEHYSSLIQDQLDSHARIRDLESENINLRRQLRDCKCREKDLFEHIEFIEDFYAKKTNE